MISPLGYMANVHEEEKVEKFSEEIAGLDTFQSEI